jgi:hypothetical protein
VSARRIRDRIPHRLRFTALVGVGGAEESAVETRANIHFWWPVAGAATVATVVYSSSVDGNAPKVRRRCFSI